MAGMNLNPYNLNNNNNNNNQNNNNNLSDKEPKKTFSNHYSGHDDLKKITEDEIERQHSRDKYFKAYGLKSTDPKEMDLNKPIIKKNKLPLIIALFVGAIIIILLAILL